MPTDTSSLIEIGRTVLTRQTTGWLTLRITTRQPKPEFKETV